MPINDTADTCWPVKTPILYKVKGWGKVETEHKDQQVRCLTHPTTSWTDRFVHTVLCTSEVHMSGRGAYVRAHQQICPA